MTPPAIKSITGKQGFRSKTGTAVIYFLLPLFWLILSAVGITVYVVAQTERAERDFEGRAIGIGSRFEEFDDGVQFVLEGFSAMLRVMDTNDPADRLMVANYAQQVRQKYPQIYMLELVERVPREDVPGFESRQSAILNEPFHIRTFDYHLSRSWLPPADKAVYYVGTLMAPMTAGARPVLGMDIESSHAQAVALHQAINTGQSAVSDLFDSIVGPRSYALIRPVTADYTRFAKLVVHAANFGALPWLKDVRDVGVTIRYSRLAEGDPRGILYSQAAPPAGTLAALFLPRFSWQKDMSADGVSPFVVSISRQMRWQDLGVPMLSTMLAVGSMVLLLLIKLALEHYHHDLDRREHEARLVYLASHDHLTGLPNRGLLLDRLEQAILRARRACSSIGLLFLDVDRFKQVNDNYGHDAGDRFLMILADTIREVVRAQDSVARLSGDEFVVLVEGVARREEVELIARKIKEAIHASICVGYRELGVGVSVGIAMFPEDGMDAHALLRHADSHMYGEKRGELKLALVV